MGLPSVTRTVPSSLIAGDSIEFLVAIPDGFSAWTGKARITGPQMLDHTSCATENSDFHVYFQGSSTVALAAGQYTLSVWATNGNDRKTVLQVGLTLQADLSAVDAPVQSHAATMLDVIKRAIAARITGTADGGIEAYSIDGRSVTKLPLEQLERLRGRYQAEVSQEQNNGTLGAIHFAFPPAIPTTGPWPLGDPRTWYR